MLKKKCFLLLTLTLCVLLASCGKTKLNPQDYAAVTFEGLNGHAEANIEVDQDALSIAALGEVPQTDSEALAYLQKEILLHSAMEYEAVPAENLKNGDKVTVTVHLDENAMDELGISFSGTEWEVEVSGLAEGEVIDLFASLEIGYSGINGEGQVTEFKNSSEDPFLKTVRYSAEPATNLSNGDCITVTAECSADTAEEYGYLLPEDLSSEFTVESLGFLLTEANQLSGSILQQAWDIARQEMPGIGSTTVPDAAYLLLYQESPDYGKSFMDWTSVLIFAYRPANGFEPYEGFAFMELVVSEDGELLDYHQEINEKYYQTFGASYDGNDLAGIMSDIRYEFMSAGEKHSVTELDCSRLK